MKFIIITMFCLYSFFIFPCSCENASPEYIPDFNLNIEEFCEQAIEKSLKLLEKAECETDQFYLYGYHDAFKIMQYKLMYDSI